MTSPNSHRENHLTYINTNGAYLIEHPCLPGINRNKTPPFKETYINILSPAYILIVLKIYEGRMGLIFPYIEEKFKRNSVVIIPFRYQYLERICNKKHVEFLSCVMGVNGENRISRSSHGNISGHFRFVMDRGHVGHLNANLIKEPY